MAIGMKERRRGEPLFEALATPAQQGSVALYWLGQAGFAVRTPQHLILIDPYLSNALAEKYKDALFKHVRMMPPPILPDELRGVDYLFASHAHSDHMDPGSIGKIMALNPGCILVCPRSARETALARGADPDRIQHPIALEPKSFGSMTVEMIPSAHEELKNDGEGNTLFAGFILDLGGIRLYHSGDCVPYDGLSGLLAQRTVDVALLPVNGRDAYRTGNGVAGNFTVEEAVALCREAGIGNLIPHHFGMFDFNTIEPREVEKCLATAGKTLHWVLPTVENCIVVSK